MTGDPFLAELDPIVVAREHLDRALAILNAERETMAAYLVGLALKELASPSRRDDTQLDREQP